MNETDFIFTKIKVENVNFMYIFAVFLDYFWLEMEALMEKQKNKPKTGITKL